ncbi:MAG: hypothetical protein WCO25_05050 [Candidatus Uhrbacteria bacterium]
MLTITLLVLLGCTGTQDTDSTSTGDADTDTDADSDSDADADISAPFTVELPAGVTGTVSAYLGDENGYEDGTPASATCDATSGSCTATVTKEGIYWVIVDSPTALFVAKSTTATADGADPSSFAWSTGGCTDPSWVAGTDPICGDSAGTLDAWIPGEWGLAPNDQYHEEGDDQYWEVETDHAALEGGGFGIVITGAFHGEEITATMAGDKYYGCKTDGSSCGGGHVDVDLSVLHVSYLSQIDTSSEKNFVEILVNF